MHITHVLSFLIYLLLLLLLYASYVCMLLFFSHFYNLHFKRMILIVIILGYKEILQASLVVVKN